MTGVAYSQSWSANGTAKPTSRYLTDAPESHSEIASERNTASRRKNGMKTMCQLGARWYQANSPRRTTNESRKSISGGVTPAGGAYGRGKSAFESSPPWAAIANTPLPAAEVK